jgi:serine/threonine protein kinase
MKRTLPNQINKQVAPPRRPSPPIIISSNSESNSGSVHSFYPEAPEITQTLDSKENTEKYTRNELEKYVDSLEYVAKGAQGVVLRGPVPCTMNRNTMYTPDYVGKLFRQTRSADKEYAVAQNIQRVDPLQLFILHILKKCDLVISNGTDTESSFYPAIFLKITEKLPEKNQNNFFKEKVESQTISPFGGSTLDQLDNSPDVYTSLIPGILLLVLLLGFMNRVPNSLYHLDIKGDNILLRPEHSSLNLIDFGLSGTDSIFVLFETMVTLSVVRRLNNVPATHINQIYFLYVQHTPEFVLFYNLAAYVANECVARKPRTLEQFYRDTNLKHFIETFSLFYEEKFNVSQEYYGKLELGAFFNSLITDQIFMKSLYKMIKKNVYKLYINTHQNATLFIQQFYSEFRDMYQPFFEKQDIWALGVCIMEVDYRMHTGSAVLDYVNVLRTAFKDLVLRQHDPRHRADGVQVFRHIVANMTSPVMSRASFIIVKKFLEMIETLVEAGNALAKQSPQKDQEISFILSTLREIKESRGQIIQERTS